MKKSIVQNVSSVTALSVLKRALGFLYRILLSRTLGAEGVGLYQTALSFYFVFVTLGSGGIPVTTSRLVCKHNATGAKNSSQNTLSAAFLLGLLITIPACLFVFLFGDKLTVLFSDRRAIAPTKLLFIGLCFSSLYHSLHGFFWGNKQLLLPTVLELVEECVNVLLGVFLLTTAPSMEVGVCRAALAVAITDVSCFLIAFVCYLAKGGKLAAPNGQLKPLFSSAAPITSMRALNSLVNSAVAVLLPAMLVKAGETYSSATSLYGVVSGMVTPVLFIPSTVIGSLAFVLVPELSENYYKKNYKSLAQNIERGLVASLFIACLVIPFLAALGVPIGAITFSSPLAGKIIAQSCPVLIPMSVSMISSGILNSMGFERQTFLFSSIGEGCMLLCILFLPKVIGVYAYIVAVGVNFTICTVCSLAFLFKRYKPSKRFFSLVFVAIASAILLSAFGKALYKAFELTLNDFWCVFVVGGSITAVLLVVLGICLMLKKRGFLSFFLQKS